MNATILKANLLVRGYVLKLFTSSQLQMKGLEPTVHFLSCGWCGSGCMEMYEYLKVV